MLIKKNAMHETQEGIKKKKKNVLLKMGRIKAEDKKKTIKSWNPSSPIQL